MNQRILHFSILILLLNSCFLFSPKPTPDTNFWGEYIPINAYAGFIKNYDANEFLESGMHPSALMRENYVRQNRPLYVVAASFIGYSIYYISNLFNTIEIINLENSVYIGYICLNFIVLLLALILFEKLAVQLSNGKIPYSTILILSVFIASNFMTKAFFWTAHQQMLAFLIPLLSIYISINFIKEMPAKWLYILFFMFGVGMLIYGSFIILLSVCMLYLCYTFYVQEKLFTLSSFRLIAICCLLSLIPTLIWITLLKYQGITYYNHEVVRYRQLVWMVDTLSISIFSFVSTTYINVMEFIKTLHTLYLFAAFFVLVLCVQKIKTGIAFHWDRNSKLIVLNLICFGCFFILLGYYANRLTFTLMPIILCLGINNAGELLRNKKVQVVMLTTVCIWHAVNVFSYGPFS